MTAIETKPESREDADGNPTCVLRLAWISLMIASAFAVAVAVARAAFNLSVTEPLQIFTSGFEEESHFAIWKWVHGQIVYADPSRIPFAASYFNWLFYCFYGVITKSVLTVFSFRDDWIVQIGKWITLAGAVVVGVGVHRILTLAVGNAAPETNQWRRWIILAAAVYVATSPLAGFWIITTRPDIWALAMELFAMLLYLRHLKSSRRADLVWFVVFCYAAWSFKHVNITVAGACIADCILRRRWRQAAILATSLGACFGATLFLGGETYRFMILQSQNDCGFFIRIGVENFVSALAKSVTAWIPWVAGLLVIATNAFARRSTLTDSPVRVLNLAAFIGLVVYLPLACKVGASDNYFLAFSTFAFLTWIAWLFESRNRTLAAAACAASMLSIVACVLLLIGKFGRLDCRDSHRRILEIKSCLAKLPKPTLAWGNQSSLPWNNQNDTNHFVLAAALYTIPVAKREQGGLDGLVASGYFAAVVDLDGSHAAVCEKAMRRADSVACPGVIYLRRENPAVK